MKKWTYLVAAGIMLGATPVFTGCIDNDEPEGITVLRGAKAELLKAKATVETAKAEQVKAKAAYLLAQAEYQKALAATENANAKIKEAIAKQEEAKVKLIETQNEQEKQKLQAQIAELEHQKEMWEIEKNSAIAAAEQAVKSWELAYKQAEVAYEKVLLELAAQKASLTKQQQLLLADYVNDVKTAKEDLAEKKEDVRLAQRAVNKAAQLVEETEADKEYWQYELARTLKLENKKLEGLEAALKEAKEGLGEFENMKPTELAAKYEALEQELNALKKKIADESVKAAEERRAIQEGELAELNKKAQAMTKSMQADVEIPAFTCPEVIGDALPFAWNNIKDKEYEPLTYMFLFLLSETFTMMVLNKILGEEEREFLNPGEMERSLICELGNIMCGSYINALASVMDLKLEVSVPDVCIDMGGAILSVPLSRFLRVSDDILMIDNLFHLGGESFLGRILFIPEPDSLDMMLRSLRE